ncbi:low quality protein: polycystic [Lynx pardinus]|uniref:Low quality protein: polycystic n=1 Tax=Lynx pardinus TaxID=191816 RepID=A0A485MYJ8_LYNPA|nr:low quality protein: polycystic [Lynx pardinus]
MACPHTAGANLSKTLCRSISPFPSLPRVMRHVLSVTSVPSSWPASETQAGKAPVEITSSPIVDSLPRSLLLTDKHSFRGHLGGSVADEPAGSLNKVIHGLQSHSKLRRACEVLQKLTAFMPEFSKSAQVFDLLTTPGGFLRSHQRAHFRAKQSGFQKPPTACLSESLNTVMEAAGASPQRSKHAIEQVENMLEMALLALGKIKETFLQQNQFSESLVTLTSIIASLMLSSQNMSIWPLSSYTLGSPAAVRLGFPRASALEELLNRQPGFNVQVSNRTSFSSFRDFDDKNIVGSIKSVLLSSNHKFFQVHDLVEDIEIMLWRNVSVEIYPTSINMSSDHFVMTVSITSLEKSLIVCIEPESPLLMTLYLGFQYQPNHTYFNLNITLPKNQVVITLYGSEGQRETHHLCDPEKAVFRELHSLWFWHDDSGASPSRYGNQELKETVGFLLWRIMYLLSELEQPLWSPSNINKQVKLLPSLLCSHIAGHGSHQRAGPHWINGKLPQVLHHFCHYLLRVLQRLQSHLSALGPTQADRPCDILDATSQLQELQELLEIHILPTEQGPFRLFFQLLFLREATSSPLLSPEEGKKPIVNGLPRWLTCISWLPLGVTSPAAAFFTAFYSLELNKDQATNWVISVILSVLQNIFISQLVKAIVLTLSISLMRNRMPCLTKEKEQQTRRILALLGNQNVHHYLVREIRITPSIQLQLSTARYKSSSASC